MRQKSVVLDVVATLFVVGGAAHMLSPAPATAPAKDETDYLLDALFIATGIGLFLRKRWGLWLIVGLALLLSVAAVINNLDYSLGEALARAGVVALLFGIPAIIVWSQRGRLERGGGEAE